MNCHGAPHCHTVTRHILTCDETQSSSSQQFTAKLILGQFASSIVALSTLPETLKMQSPLTCHSHSWPRIVLMPRDVYMSTDPTNSLAWVRPGDRLWTDSQLRRTTCLSTWTVKVLLQQSAAAFRGKETVVVGVKTRSLFAASSQPTAVPAGTQVCLSCGSRNQFGGPAQVQTALPGGSNSHPDCHPGCLHRQVGLLALLLDNFSV